MNTQPHATLPATIARFAFLLPDLTTDSHILCHITTTSTTCWADYALLQAAETREAVVTQRVHYFVSYSITVVVVLLLLVLWIPLLLLSSNTRYEIHEARFPAGKQYDTTTSLRYLSLSVCWITLINFILPTTINQDHHNLSRPPYIIIRDSLNHSSSHIYYNATWSICVFQLQPCSSSPSAAAQDPVVVLLITPACPFFVIFYSFVYHSIGFLTVSQPGLSCDLQPYLVEN